MRTVDRQRGGELIMGSDAENMFRRRQCLVDVYLPDDQIRDGLVSMQERGNQDGSLQKSAMDT